MSEDYTIDKVLDLLRDVPADGPNSKLVVDVVKKTLESAGIDILTLLSGANERQDAITNEIVRLQTEISSLHSAIEEKTDQVSKLQAYLTELGHLKERFE